MFHRISKLSKNNSFFLFGPRGSGKSTLIQEGFSGKKTLFLDLLDPEIEDHFLRQPKSLENQIKENPNLEWVVLDEIQRVPRLLDLVHSLIEKTKIKFALTGSSARKLKRGAANLLAGRAFVYKLFPLTTQELGEKFDLHEVLSFGSLPKIYQLNSTEEKILYLRSYALTYVKEEIQTEQIVRNLEPFRAFLEISALANGQIINFNKIARDVGADNKTVQSYFQILEDTWLGFFLPSYHRSIRKSQRSHPKFYYFDPGIKRALTRNLEGKLETSTSAFGEAFEHWVILEFYRLNEYLQKDYRLSYFQSHQGSEIDLILDKPGQKPVVIEIKSTQRIDEIEVRKLERLSEDFKTDKIFYLSRDPVAQKIDSVHCLEWKEGLKNIFNHNQYSLP